MEARPAELPVVSILGPTASGKTALALALAERLPCEIISVDSALVYRGMDIGTAKPDADELARVPHHLIDIRDPSEPYSAADFRADALRLIAQILERKKIPLLVGGTMLYFKLLFEGMATLPPANLAIRARIAAEAEQSGWPHLHQQLARLDPVSADRIHPNHSQRLSRALEICLVSGQPMSALLARQQAQQLPWSFTHFALMPTSRQWLHERIARRFHLMMEQGFLQEVETLYQRGDLLGDLPAIRAVGYRQAWDYLGGNLSREEMVDRAIIATRQLAKRQLTWLRGWPDLNLLAVDSTTKTENLLFQALKILESDSIEW